LLADGIDTPTIHPPLVGSTQVARALAPGAVHLRGAQLKRVRKSQMYGQNDFRDEHIVLWVKQCAQSNTSRYHHATRRRFHQPSATQRLPTCTAGTTHPICATSRPVAIPALSQAQSPVDEECASPTRSQASRNRDCGRNEPAAGRQGGTLPFCWPAVAFPRCRSSQPANQPPNQLT
jgi:hypothetical protein